MRTLYHREGNFEAARWGRLVFAARGKGNYFLRIGPYVYMHTARVHFWALNLGFTKLIFNLRGDEE